MSSGFLSKMPVQLKDGQVYYTLPLEQPIELNSFLGQAIKLEFLGQMQCAECGRNVKKTFQQGYCFPCTQAKACCDLCIFRPERCHFHLGTCREPEWGQNHCMQKHVVYLANTSGIKVGITRIQNVPQRFIDQGATEALPIFEVETRRDSGLIEVEIAKFLDDKTNWRKMLQGVNEGVDLEANRVGMMQILERVPLFQELKIQESQIGKIKLNYPILRYPTKLVSLNFDKTPVIEGVLEGIKGQYLMLSTGVLNIRNFSGYKIQFTSGM